MTLSKRSLIGRSPDVDVLNVDDLRQNALSGSYFTELGNRAGIQLSSLGLQLTPIPDSDSHPPSTEG